MKKQKAPTSLRITTENEKKLETLTVYKQTTAGKVVNEAIKVYYEIMAETLRKQHEVEKNIVYKEMKKLNKGVK